MGSDRLEGGTSGREREKERERCKCHVSNLHLQINLYIYINRYKIIERVFTEQMAWEEDGSYKKKWPFVLKFEEEYIYIIFAKF